MRRSTRLLALAVVFAAAACTPETRYLEAFKTLPTLPLPMPAAAPTPPPAAPKPLNSSKPAWLSVPDWGMQTASYDQRGLAPIAASAKGMVIVGRHNALGQPWPRAEVDAAAENKWLLAYMAVGEAQKSEWYWQNGWGVGNPPWIVGNNPYFANNVYADLASRDWWNLQFATLDRIIDQGFNGVFLDVPDIYWLPGYPGGPSRENMAKAVNLVCALAQHGRARVPGFKLVPNNAINLTSDFPGYANCIDGQLVEGLWYINIGGPPRDEFYRHQKVEELRSVSAAGKPIFSLDYAPDYHIELVTVEARKQGYLPYVTPGGGDAPLR